MKARLIVVFFIFVIVSACAGNQRPIVVDPMGRNIPSPHYVLSDMRGYGIDVLFYYTLLEGTKDLDGTVQNNPIYLEIMKVNEFAKGAKVSLTIEIRNPNKHTYQLWERVQYINAGQDGTNMKARGGRLAVSNLPYRQFVYDLSTDPSLKTVTYGIDLISDRGEVLMNMGNFNYLVSNSNVIHNSTGSPKEEPIRHNVKGGTRTPDQLKELNKN